jgi:hypothetical protein
MPLAVCMSEGRRAPSTPPAGCGAVCRLEADEAIVEGRGASHMRHDVFVAMWPMSPQRPQRR